MRFIVKFSNRRATVTPISKDEYKSRAATKIQSVIRRFQSLKFVLQRLSELHAVLVTRCAVTVQCFVRRVLARMLFQRELSLQRSCRIQITMLQSLVRCYLAKIRVRRRLKFDHDVTIVQSCIRRFLALRRVGRMMYLRKLVAVQAWARR